jgi:hypothetical protein
MTEQEWISCTDPNLMLDHLCGRRVYNRKLRLFACACCRSIWDVLKDERSRAAVELAERFADRKANRWELERAIAAAFDAINDGLDGIRDVPLEERDPNLDIQINVADAAWRTASLASIHESVQSILGRTSLGKNPSLTHVLLFRDIFGRPYPFHQTKVESAWLTWGNGTLPRMAQRIYDDRAFDNLPSVANALEQAGCANAEILTHCRQPGPHVRGCWVVDLILGKE